MAASNPAPRKNPVCPGEDDPGAGGKEGYQYLIST